VGCRTETAARDLEGGRERTTSVRPVIVSILILLGSILVETAPPGKSAMCHSYRGLPAYRRVWSKKG